MRTANVSTKLVSSLSFRLPSVISYFRSWCVNRTHTAPLDPFKYEREIFGKESHLVPKHPAQQHTFLDQSKSVVSLRTRIHCKIVSRAEFQKAQYVDPRSLVAETGNSIRPFSARWGAFKKSDTKGWRTGGTHQLVKLKIPDLPLDFSLSSVTILSLCPP